MGYRAVIFDLDGTLLDSLEDLAGAGNRTLAAMRLPDHPVSAYRLFVGDGMRTLVSRILPENLREESVLGEALSRFKEEYHRRWQEKSTLYDGIEAMLDRLADAGCLLSILSNKPHDFTRVVVDHFLHRWRFVPVFGQRPGVPKKPDPAAAAEIAAILGVEPKEVLFVGDSGVDMETAMAAGMDAVGVLWGFRDENELRKSGARHIITHPSELPELLFSAADMVKKHRL